nr:hypothetical protein Muribac2_700 [uncultured Muribaculaceae bacterium]
MKIFNKIGIAVSLVVTALISSCSDKGYWDEAPLEQGYSFNAANYTEELKPGPQDIKITLHRSIATSDESVAVNFTPAKGCPSDITVESPVTFKAGSSTAEVNIHIADANPPYTYSGTLEFSGDASYSGIAKCTLKMPVSYTWVSIGTGKFYDAFVMNDSMFDVEIVQAEGFKRYRVMNPYKEFYQTGGAADYGDMYGSNGPSYIEFWEVADGLLMYNAWATGLIHQGDPENSINAYPWSALSSGVEGFDIWNKPGHALLSPIYYIPGVGGYGQQQYAVQIILP